MGLIDSVAQILAIDEATVNQIADKAPSYYRTYRIPKRNRSGFRTIYHPAKQTKALQYAIITTLLSNLLISKIAYAYKYGLKSPLKENASQHSKYKYSLHIDFKDFFPSIKPKDLFKSLSKNDIILNEPEKVFLQNALFIRRKGIFELSIGAPSSPIISNIIMYDFDNEIIRIAKSLDLDSVITRYSDDIVFSTNKKSISNTFYDQILKYIESQKHPSLRINKNKTRFTSRRNRRVVTGLIITPEGNLSIGRDKKRYVKSLIYNYKIGKLEQHKINHLKGYLAYIIDVEPRFFNSLVQKYSGPVVNGILNSNVT